MPLPPPFPRPDRRGALQAQRDRPAAPFPQSTGRRGRTVRGGRSGGAVQAQGAGARVPFPRPGRQGRVIQGSFPIGLRRLAGGPCDTRVLQAFRSDATRLPTHLLDERGASSGEPLPASLQTHMERFFEHDFSQVRVHVGPEAEQIGAVAFTVGTDLYFAPGRYDPDSLPGQALIGHELTHVVQQQAGRVANPFGRGLAVVYDPELEAEADRMGEQAAQAAAQARFAPGRRRPPPFARS